MSTETMSKEMFKLWEQSWQPYFKTITAMQDQSDRMMELMLSQNPLLPEETKKFMLEWGAQARKIQQGYVELVQGNIRKVQELIEKQ